MHSLTTIAIDCPYCGEIIEVVLDLSLPQQDYIEDCQVCCRPMRLSVLAGEDDSVEVVARHENEC